MSFPEVEFKTIMLWWDYFPRRAELGWKLPNLQAFFSNNLTEFDRKYVFFHCNPMREFHHHNIPIPSFQVFGDLAKNQVLEIGAGVGYHSLQMALAHPQWEILAIERTTEKYKKALRRFKNHPNIQNLSLLQCDAVAYVAHFLAEKSLDRIEIMYPNPSPKNSSGRWTQMSFFPVLISKLKAGGILSIATNLFPYFVESSISIEKNDQLQISSQGLIARKRKPRSHFEKKYLDNREDCYEIIALSR